MLGREVVSRLLEKGYTVGALVIAAAVFAVVARFAKNPVRTYTMIATIALLLSFVMHVVTLFGIPDPSGNELSVAPLDAVIVMILTHITAFVVSTLIFTRLTHES